MTQPLTFAQELDRIRDADYLATTRKPPQPHIPRGRTMYEEFLRNEAVVFGRVK